MQPRKQLGSTHGEVLPMVRCQNDIRRASLLQASGCRGRQVTGSNHEGSAGCSGPVWRAARALEGLSAFLQRRALLEAPWPNAEGEVFSKPDHPFALGFRGRDVRCAVRALRASVAPSPPTENTLPSIAGRLFISMGIRDAHN